MTATVPLRAEAEALVAALASARPVRSAFARGERCLVELDEDLVSRIMVVLRAVASAAPRGAA